MKKLKCSGTGGGLALESFKDIRVGLNTCPVDLGRQQSLDPIDSEELKDLVGDDRTSTSLITVRLSEDIQVKASFKAGLRHGQCEVTFARGDIRSIKGEYRAGRLSGRARVVFSPGNSLDGFFSAWWGAWCRTVEASWSLCSPATRRSSTPGSSAQTREGADEGLFARQDIEINRVLAFYNNTLTSFIPWTPTILVDCWSLKHIGASFNDPLSVDIDMVSTAKNINGIFNSIYLLHFWALRII